MYTGFSVAATAALTSAHRLVVRQVLVKNSAGAVLQDITYACTAGEITEDETASYRRVLSLNVNDPNLVPRDSIITDLLHPLSGNEIWVYKGIFAPGATAAELAPMGVFRMSKPQITDDQSGWQMTITGNDRSFAIAQHKWTGTYTPTAGQNIALAIQAIVNLKWMGPQLVFNFEPTTATVPQGTVLGVTFSSGGITTPSGAPNQAGQNNPWTDCVALAQGAGMQLYFDRVGNLVMTPQVTDPKNLPVAFSFVEGPGCSVVGGGRTLDETQFANLVQVIGTGATVTNLDGSFSPGPAVIGTAQSNDPNIGVNGPLGTIPLQVVNDLISTQAQANTAAQAQLVQSLAALTATDFEAADDPRLDATDIVYFHRQRLDGYTTSQAATLKTAFVVQAVVHPLALTDAMQVTHRSYTVATLV